MGMGWVVNRRGILAWVLERSQYLFAYLGNGNDSDAYGRAEGGYLGINVAGAFIFPKSGGGLGSSTCVDSLGSGCIYG